MDVVLASNLVWLLTSLSILGMTCWSIRRRTLRVSTASAITLALLVGIVLLPAISLSDDMLEAHQAALPLSAQTWRMSSEGASVGVELVPILTVCLLLLARSTPGAQIIEDGDWDMHPHSAWLARSLRLRPPPAEAH